VPKEVITVLLGPDLPESSGLFNFFCALKLEEIPKGCFLFLLSFFLSFFLSLSPNVCFSPPPFPFIDVGIAYIRQKMHEIEMEHQVVGKMDR